MSQDSYQSFLLRLWRRGGTLHSEALLMLENTHTGERIFFAGVADLAAYLEAQAGERPDEGGQAQVSEPE